MRQEVQAQETRASLARRLGCAAALATFFALALGGSGAKAVAPPGLGTTWTSTVLATSGRLHAEINPNGLATTYRFDYVTKAGYEANLAAGKEGFDGAARAPGSEGSIGSGATVVAVVQLLSGLSPETAYRYRVVAKSSVTVTGPTQVFLTQGLGGGSLLADSRGWEMVSPVDKNGGKVDLPGSLFSGGVFQAATGGGSVTYGSFASFGEGPQGAPPASQYLAIRGQSAWSTQNITAPLYSGAYGAQSEGVPYQLFSGDLARGLLLNGGHCRGEDEGCAVANPPLAGTDAPEGYQNYYLRDNATGSFAALLGASAAGELALQPAEFELSLVGAAPDLRHAVLSTCAALTPDAVEVPLGQGCDLASPNLYEWSGSGLTLLNLLPAQSMGDPGAALAAQGAAVSLDGSRVYWRDLETGNLYLREGGQTKQVDVQAGGGGAFQTASADGLVAFYTKAGHLWRYEAAGVGFGIDLTPSGGVVGVLGASEDGSRLYYATDAGLFLWNGATTTQVAVAADSSNYPPTTGTAHVSADGTHLAFLSTVPLTNFDNTDENTGDPDSEVYLFASGAGGLICVSCNPTNERPIGASTIPGAIANGGGSAAIGPYKPRVLSTGGGRLFFDSDDALVLADTNADADVYEWEAQGVGSCARLGGCIALVSSGKAEGGASFIDASSDGSDAFFLTDGSLVSSDPGSVDLYDARVGGGFPTPSPPIACQGDACQILPPEPVDPGVNTLLAGLGNPAVHYRHYKKHLHGKHWRHARNKRHSGRGHR